MKIPCSSRPQISRVNAVCRLGLAAWLFLLSLGGVSPALHAWLHGESVPDAHCGLGEGHSHPQPDSGHRSPPEHPEHFCGVFHLQSGALPAAGFQLPLYAPLVWADLFSPSECAVIRSVPLHRFARAPPIEIVV